MPVLDKPTSSGRVAFTYPNFVFSTARFFMVCRWRCNPSPSDGRFTTSPNAHSISASRPGPVCARLSCCFSFSGHAADLFDRRKLARRVLRRLRPLFRALCSRSRLCAPRNRSTRSTSSWSCSESLRSLSGRPAAPCCRNSFPTSISPMQSPGMPPPFRSQPLLGPAIGGIVYALFRGPEAVYAIAVTVSIPPPSSPCDSSAAHLAGKGICRKSGRDALSETEPVSLRTVLAGFRYVWETQGHPRLHLARSVRRPARRRSRVTPRLRARHSAHRTLGTRPAALRSAE